LIWRLVVASEPNTSDGDLLAIRSGSGEASVMPSACLTSETSRVVASRIANTWPGLSSWIGGACGTAAVGSLAISWHSRSALRNTASAWNQTSRGDAPLIEIAGRLSAGRPISLRISSTSAASWAARWKQSGGSMLSSERWLT